MVGAHRPLFILVYQHYTILLYGRALTNRRALTSIPHPFALLGHARNFNTYYIRRDEVNLVLMLIAEKYNEYIDSATRKHDFLRNLIGNRRGGAEDLKCLHAV